jgi:predicted RNA-binding Zn-ribbon protein involved in translation (DUF1610 family)
LRVREDMAGKRIKCPRCGQIVTVPADEAVVVEEVTEMPDEEKITAEPPTPKARAPRPQTRPCPECGERIAVTARKCRYCKADLSDEEEDEDDRPIRRRSSYKPCPRCGEEGATRVTWTPWGSFYGPALFTHVRCPGCGYAYNGRTGRSNLIPAIIFVLVPLMGILLILGFLGWIIYSMSAKGG